MAKTRARVTPRLTPRPQLTDNERDPRFRYAAHQLGDHDLCGLNCRLTGRVTEPEMSDREARMRGDLQTAVLALGGTPEDLAHVTLTTTRRRTP